MIKGRKPVAFAGTASCQEILQLKRKEVIMQRYKLNKIVFPFGLINDKQGKFVTNLKIYNRKGPSILIINAKN
jgi:hypothetical protein